MFWLRYKKNNFSLHILLAKNMQFTHYSVINIHTELHGSSVYPVSIKIIHILCIPGRVAQSVTCLATDACLTAIPGVVSSIPARSHTFVGD